MGEWKIILGNETRELKGMKGAEGRTATFYQIVTHDGYTFVVSDYEIINQSDISLGDNGEMKLGGIVEIDGIYYKTSGNTTKYMTDFNGIINCYIRDWKIAKPQYDISDMNLAIKYFKELIELKNNLLMLK